MFAFLVIPLNGKQNQVLPANEKTGLNIMVNDKNNKGANQTRPSNQVLTDKNKARNQKKRPIREHNPEISAQDNVLGDPDDGLRSTRGSTYTDSRTVAQKRSKKGATVRGNKTYERYDSLSSGNSDSTSDNSEDDESSIDGEGSDQLEMKGRNGKRHVYQLPENEYEEFQAYKRSKLLQTTKEGVRWNKQKATKAVEITPTGARGGGWEKESAAKSAANLLALKTGCRYDSGWKGLASGGPPKQLKLSKTQLNTMGKVVREHLRKTYYSVQKFCETKECIEREALVLAKRLVVNGYLDIPRGVEKEDYVEAVRKQVPVAFRTLRHNSQTLVRKSVVGKQGIGHSCWSL